MTTKKDEKVVEAEKVLDLAQFDTEALSDDGVWLSLENPVTGELLSIRIKLAGIDSKKYQKQLRISQDKRLKRFSRARSVSGVELENERLALLAAITLEWEGIVENGKSLECSAVNIRHVYDKYAWIREQVDAFAGDRANFIKS